MRAVHRLTAILAADVEGYSRLMGADEEGTHERLQTHFRELIDPKIGEHSGRVVKYTGDGLLAEFPSVVDAVRCAAEWQRGMLGREPGVSEERRIRFRIGVNLGDIIAEGGDIFGDGVNVAARLEGLAEPGGICVSGRVHEEVRDKLRYEFDDMGEQSLKNIARPMRAFAISAAAVARTPLMPVKPLARAVVTTASSLAEEFVLQSIMGSQITLYTVDATLIDKGTPSTKTVSDPASGRIHTETTYTCVFAFDDGRHYSVRLTNFDLPFVTGVRVTIFLFITPQGREGLFSLYNHCARVWWKFPFDRNIELNTNQEGRFFILVMAVLLLIVVAAWSWFKESQQVVAVLWVLPILVGLVFMVRNWLRRERLISRMQRLQHHVKFS